MEKNFAVNFTLSTEEVGNEEGTSVVELSELQLVAVGGGAGDTIWA